MKSMRMDKHLYLLIFSLIFSACTQPVVFIKYHETGCWKSVQNEYFIIRIPCNWSINLEKTKETQVEKINFIDKVLQGESEKRNLYYNIIDEKQQKVCKVLVTEGGPEFIRCLCTSESNYNYSKVGEYKIWTLDGNQRRIIKVANKVYRLDIHLDYDNREKPEMDYIIESTRPIK